MGHILTEAQKAKRMFDKGGQVSLAIMFPCRKCGHANRPARTKLESMKLYLMDELPLCRRCGWELKKRDYDRSAMSDSLVKKAQKALGNREVVSCKRCLQKLRVPTDK